MKKTLIKVVGFFLVLVLALNYINSIFSFGVSQQMGR